MFEICERQEAAYLRISLDGDLDLATARQLEDRLSRLRSTMVAVRLDLSRLDFMDCAGVHVLIDALEASRPDGWVFELEGDLSPQVRRLVDLITGDPVRFRGAQLWSVGPLARTRLRPRSPAAVETPRPLESSTLSA